MTHSTTLAILGAGGRLGRHVVQAALSRGHIVDAALQRTNPLPEHPALRPRWTYTTLRDPLTTYGRSATPVDAAHRVRTAWKRASTSSRRSATIHGKIGSTHGRVRAWRSWSTRSSA